MKKFYIMLDSFVVGIVEVSGDEADYDRHAHDDLPDYVVKRAGKEVLRVARENILYVTISEASTI